MYSDTQSANSGYVHETRAAKLADRAATYCLQSNCSPVFAISQDIIQDPASVLNTICLHLYNKGAISGNKIHNISLLVLLSSGMSQQDMLRQIEQVSARNDGVVFLEDAYRYGYDRNRACSLIDTLIRLRKTPRQQCPLVIKMPPPCDRFLFQYCPSLRDHCFHLGSEPLSAPREAASYTRPAPEPILNAASPRANATPSAGSVTQNQQSRPRSNGFWYNDDLQLLQAEYEGLRRYLQTHGLRSQQDKPSVLSRSRRMCFHLSVYFQELGECILTIVYDNTFSRDARTRLAIAIKSRQHLFIREKLHTVSKFYDEEIGGNLFLPTCNSNTMQSYGSAAAVLDGFIRAMIK